MREIVKRSGIIGESKNRRTESMTEESFLARRVSKIFEPMVIALSLASIAGWHANIRGGAFALYMLYLVGVGVVIAIARVKFMRSMKTNWDVSSRVKRVRLLILLLAFSVVLFWSIHVWYNSVLTSVYELFVLWLIGFFLVTLSIKISGHMAVLVFAIGLLVSWFEISFWSLSILVPILGWSRVKLKRHSVLEVVLGVIYSLGVLFLYGKTGLRIFR